MISKRESTSNRKQQRRTNISCVLLSALAANNAVYGFTPSTSFRVQNSQQAFVNNKSSSLKSGRRRHRSDSTCGTNNNGLYLSSTCTTNNDDPMNNRHSASDWLYNIKSLPQSKVLREIRNPVLAVAAWSFVVSAIHTVGNSASWAPPILQYVARKMCIPGTAHSFLVSALGLLLVFRTNSAYQRFNVRVSRRQIQPSRI
jgi:Bestrophin, RFP-TM, chloride channel